MFREILTKDEENLNSILWRLVIGMMGDRFKPLERPYDCDGDFSSTSVTNQHYTSKYTEKQYIDIIDENSVICKLFIVF